MKKPKTNIPWDNYIIRKYGKSIFNNILDLYKESLTKLNTVLRRGSINEE